MLRLVSFVSVYLPNCNGEENDMKLVIDLQGAQTESRYRGIGRQARSLATAIIEHASAHDVYLLFNGALKSGLDESIQEFRRLLPRSQIKIFQIPSGVRELEARNMWRMRVAELAREAYLADMRADIVHLSSLFEGVHDDAVTSIGLMQAPHLTSVTFFDLIPLYDPDLYLGADFMRHFFYRRAQSLKRADLLLAISESARREAMEMLHIPGERIDVALLAAGSTFRKVDLSAAQEAALRSKYKLPKSFILYVGAIEARKNISLMIEAFAKLPAELQQATALVFGGGLHEPERLQLRMTAVRFDVDLAKIVFTGYIQEEDLAPLYGICDLFIFPSIHEGFGLPPLEAMACGAPVFAARNSSLPEVMGRDDLMFGTYDADELAKKMQRILTDPEYARSVREWGVEQAARFSWSTTGSQALQSLEKLYEKNQHKSRTSIEFKRKPRLAFFSPLPSDRSGIADYSAELLRELGRFYDMECIVHHSAVSDPWILSNFIIRDVEFFKKHANGYDRILYSVGNSEFHVHMFDLLQEFPGVVILHDFFLSGVFDWMGNVHQRPPEDFLRQLYLTHGLPAIEYVFKEGREAAVTRYPANHVVFEYAHGIVVHSQWAMSRAQDIYGSAISEKMIRLPLLRAVLPRPDRRAARRRLGIPPNAFVVCSFGFVADTKLSDRLFAAWAASEAGRYPGAYLIFVGENIGGTWCDSLARSMEALAGKVNAEITGYVDTKVYNDYLVAADLAVQLRTNSRGETSRAVLDCMAACIPVIVNSHGTTAEIAEGVVMKLPDTFSDQQLVNAIDKLFKNREAREKLGVRGRDELAARHHPAIVGEQIYEAVERFSRFSSGGNQCRLLEGLREVHAPVYPDDLDYSLISEAIARNTPRVGLRRILYDVTLLAESDAHTGIERVVRSVFAQIIQEPPERYRVEPVRIDGTQLRFARDCVARKLGIPANVLPDSLVDVDSGDIYVAFEWAADRLPQVADWLQDFRRRGGRVVICIYDLLPLQIPHRFPAHIAGVAQRWFETTLRVADQLLCISRCVADDVVKYGNALSSRRNGPIHVDYFHLSHDIKSSLPTRGLPSHAPRLLTELKRRKTFLMVGTVEPRKGHLQTIQAFQYLWAQGVDANLVVVGKKGWSVDDVDRMISKNAQRDKKLFWLRNISDEFLELIYANATALIAASEAEGFGLPLVEAAAHKLPLIVRDIPVFHEVAGQHAFYFKGMTPEEMGEEIKKWLSLARAGNAPDSSKVTMSSWRESVNQFFCAVSSDTHYGIINPGS
jgi:glycosyltransferase involved in cell wall biosynthesis